MGPHHHHNDNPERDRHFKQILKQQNNDQKIFGDVYLRHHRPVRRHDPHAAGYGLVKQVPHGQTYKNKDMKILFLLSEDHHKDKPVHQHK